MEVLMVGAFGGVTNEVLHWYGLRKRPEFPKYAKRPFYWIVTLLMIAVGAGFAFIQLGPGEQNLLLPFELGLLAPLILKKAVSSGAMPTGAMNGTNGNEANLSNFLRG